MVPSRCWRTGRADVRILFAPIAITPTKALTPSHLKALLWADVLCRSTRRVHELHYLSNRRTFDVTHQVIAFWAYLDEKGIGPESLRFGHPDDLPEDLRITALYVQQHKERYVPAPDQVHAYRRRIEDGFVHPVSQRLLAIWQEQLAWLGAQLPSVFATERLAITVEETVERLSRLGVCLDYRPLGGPLYLDATELGLPLRKVSAGPGDFNYVLCVLRELLPVAAHYDAVLLAFDREAEADYMLVSEVLRRAGANPVRLRLDRVPVDGEITSARSGGLAAYAVDALQRELRAYPLEAVRLGMRLYFIAYLGKTAKESISFPLLHRFVRRAAAMLESPAASAPAEAVDAMLLDMTRRTVCVDPYRLTSSLMDRGERGALGRSLIPEIFL
jgi:hypothetical protein